ncbi:MAG: hypothetical protein BAJALOKI3v1_1050002 [Promethearchaeota archaeon]|jgi:hypothetical protein|nr:MAG: hypothetical protein BAJALOKI3v1_1050002 [Candidatus Lokiarchaeota archaeon]
MIPYISFLRKARVLIVDLLSDEIRSDKLSENLSQLKVLLKSGIIIYISYNEYGEYGYQINYSPEKNDFSRFDNFDDRWNVSTKPHHFHKGNAEVIASPMSGEPNHDIPILVKFVKEGTINRR